ncbi:MAG: Zn-dependent oligopeptidase [Planctomycetes bacterium]|nr:Zn-dependent oligopeptidase [Planctomycetota bacterium]
MVDDLLGITGASDLENRSQAVLDACGEILGQIKSRAGEASGRDGTLRPLDEIQARLGDTRRTICLIRSVHPAADLREAAERCERMLADFASELALDRDLYEAVKECDPGALDAEGRRLREHLLRDFRRSGVDRDEATRDEIHQLHRELVELGQEFSRNILQDVRSIRLDGLEELAGLPDDYIAAHPPGEDGRITITTEYPDYNPFMVYARSSSRREELYRAFRSRAFPANIAVLRRILQRRHRLASLLGYSSWADYAAEDKMIGSAKAIGEFIERVAAAAARRSSREYRSLLDRKRRDDPSAAEVYDWEKSYYEELLRIEQYRIDSREIRPYLGYDAVKAGVFDFAARLFGLEFRPAPEVPRWHEEVEVLDVLEGGSLRGRIYLDTHPREGKYKHAAMFPIVHGVRGGRRPAAALVCNFARPESGGGSALLDHDDVVTFFHEFGHLLHHLLGCETDWVQFSGTSTEWDFVEVPSQLLEEWAWEPEVLQSFARHHKTGEVIPSDLVQRLRRARDFGRGLQVRQQMYYARLSLDYHDRAPETLDVERLSRELHSRYSLFGFVDGTHFEASFGHLEGYSALYYTYMWSMVIEKDLFSRFRERGLFDPEMARLYRRKILERGGSLDAADLVRDFLGRDYRFDAYEEWLDGERSVQ